MQQISLTVTDDNANEWVKLVHLPALPVLGSLVALNASYRSLLRVDAVIQQVDSLIIEVVCSPWRSSWSHFKLEGFGFKPIKRSGKLSARLRMPSYPVERRVHAPKKKGCVFLTVEDMAQRLGVTTTTLEAAVAEESVLRGVSVAPLAYFERGLLYGFHVSKKLDGRLQKVGPLVSAYPGRFCINDTLTVWPISKTQAYRWVRGLCDEGLVRKVKQGTYEVKR